MTKDPSALEFFRDSFVLFVALTVETDKTSDVDPVTKLQSGGNRVTNETRRIAMARNTKTKGSRVKVKDLSGSLKRLSGKDLKKLKGGADTDITDDARKKGGGGISLGLHASVRDANLFS